MPPKKAPECDFSRSPDFAETMEQIARGKLIPASDTVSFDAPIGTTAIHVRDAHSVIVPDAHGRIDEEAAWADSSTVEFLTNVPMQIP